MSRSPWRPPPGAGSLIIGVLLVDARSDHVVPAGHVRVFAGVAAILLALVSLPVSNIGGFLVGFLLALLGGALAVSVGTGQGPGRGRRGSGDAARAPDGRRAPWRHVTQGRAPGQPGTAYGTLGRRGRRTGRPTCQEGIPADGANGGHSAG